MAAKKAFKKRLNQFIQLPGALVCLIIYTIMASLGLNNRIGDDRVKSVFMVAIPWVSWAIWSASFAWIFYSFYHGNR